MHRLSKFSFLLAILYGLSSSGCGGGGGSGASNNTNLTPSTSTAIPVIDARVAPALPDTPMVLTPVTETEVVLQSNPNAVPEPEPAITPAPVPEASGLVPTQPGSGVTVTTTLAVATPTTGGVAGQVIDAATGIPIVGVSIEANGTTATTSLDGRFQLVGLAPSPRVVINVRKSSYAESLSVASVAVAATATVLTKLLPIAIEQTIDNALGGVISVPNSAAQVALPPNAFGVGVGSVTIAVTPVNPALDSAVMPGDYTTANGTQSIESFGALIVTPRDANGNAVNLVAGKQATIRIPASSRTAVIPAQVPLFSLNPTSGSWEQEGTTALSGIAPRAFYEATVSHFSAWNADQMIDTVLVTGCVKDAFGFVVPGATVRSDGSNYSSAATALTNNIGFFSVRMKRSAIATLTAYKPNGQLSNTLQIESTTDNNRLLTCLVMTGARNAATIKLTWGFQPSDLDSYLYTPSGVRINYSNRGVSSAAPYANLDVDDTSGFGPEVITVSRLMVGTYIYGVDNYSNDFTTGQTGSPMRVEINVGGNQRVFTAPPGEAQGTKFLRLFSFRVDTSCNVTLTPIGRWETAVPAAPATSTVVTYCGAR